MNTTTTATHDGNSGSIVPDWFVPIVAIVLILFISLLIGCAVYRFIQAEEKAEKERQENLQKW